MSKKCVASTERNIKLIMDECLQQYDSIMERKCAVAGENIYKPEICGKFHNFSNGFSPKSISECRTK